MNEERKHILVLNDQGGEIMHISYDVVGTLRAQMDGHPPGIIDVRKGTDESRRQKGVCDREPPE